MKSALWAKDAPYYDEITYFERFYGPGTRPKIIDWTGKYFDIIDQNLRNPLELWKEVEALCTQPLCAGVVVLQDEEDLERIEVLSEISTSYKLCCMLSNSMDKAKLFKLCTALAKSGIVSWLDAWSEPDLDEELIKTLNYYPFSLVRAKSTLNDKSALLRPDIAIWYDKKREVQDEQASQW